MRISDWSSDVCSSDLCFFHIQGRQDRVSNAARASGSDCRQIARDWPAAYRRSNNAGPTGLENCRSCPPAARARRLRCNAALPDRKSIVEGKRGAVRVVLGGRRIMKKKKKKKKR